MKRRLFLCILCLAVIVASIIILPTHANAATSGTCGENLTWTLSSTGTLTITGTGEMYDYSDPFESIRSSIKTVVICNGVTNIGYRVFSSCSNMTSITIPDSVTRIESSAFSSCDSLTSVTIPNSVTWIGSSAFSWCQSLTSITIPHSVTSIGDYAFYKCTSLISVTIGKGVTSIGANAFSECESLRGIWVNSSNPKYSSDAQGSLFNKGKTKLLRAPTRLYEPYSISSEVTYIARDAFLEGFAYGFSVDKNNPNYSSDECGVLFNKDKTELIRALGSFSGTYTVPDTVVRIADDAFCNACPSKLIIPDSVISLGTLDFNYINYTSYGNTQNHNIRSIGFLFVFIPSEELYGS